MGESTSHMKVETQDVARNDDVNSTSLSPQFLASLQLVAGITAAASNGNTATPYSGPPMRQVPVSAATRLCARRRLLPARHSTIPAFGTSAPHCHLVDLPQRQRLRVV